MNALFSSEQIPITSEDIPATLPLILSDPSDCFEEVIAELTMVVYDPPSFLTHIEHTGVVPASLVDPFPVVPAAPRKRGHSRKLHISPEVVVSEPTSTVPATANPQVLIESSNPP